MLFSQRIGRRPVKTVLQIESIDEDLRNRLWNTILESFINKLKDPFGGKETERGQVFAEIWKDFLNKPLDEIPRNGYGNVHTDMVQSFIKKWFYKAPWFEVYDLIEIMAYFDGILNLGFVKSCNLSLEREVSGFRIVNDKVIQITTEIEIKEIEEAMDSIISWESITIHLASALDLLSDRKNPDYRNSIKESISAVESLCAIITNDKNATLGKALSEIEKRYSFHKSLRSSLSSLYGYTSDSSGIRHALTEGDTMVGFEDAKFMLVSCSAFINYLKVKMKK